MDVSWGEIISEIEKVLMTFVHAVLFFSCTCSSLLVHTAGAVIVISSLIYFNVCNNIFNSNIP